MASWLDSLLGGSATATATAAAGSATNTALDTASARPFNIIITVDDPTRRWLAAIAAGIVVGVVITSAVGGRK